MNKPNFALDKSFNPKEIESYWNTTWETLGLSCVTNKADCDNFSIVLPPPNVTGVLHMGHAFNQTIMDAITRYQRMQGANTLWLPGTDHAGIATQMVVERQLEAEGKKRLDITREAFIERVWQWKKQSGNTITSQIRQLGSSVDWSMEYFTLDSNMSQAVTKVFVELYEQNLIYRGKRLINWDPQLQTAVSDLEVIPTEEDGFMWHIRYPIIGHNAHITIATTRPETLLGDVAVMVHPADSRYAHLIGQRIALPLVNREIPIIADEAVDQNFGTGAVKVTPAHDFNDYQVGIRHNLPVIEIFTLDAHLNSQVPKAYSGLSREDARKKIVDDLQAADLMADIKPHHLMVPRSQRSQTIVEPMLSDQWFVGVTKPRSETSHYPKQSMAQIARQAVSDGHIHFVPENWANTYFQWLDNIQDWCISRQLWWGHQIPAWYADDGTIYVALDEAKAYEKARANGYFNELTRDPDVLDTWFSSALIPFSALGWPENTEKLDRFLPSSVLVTGFDILFFWVARMIMLTMHFTGRIPFKTIYMHGLVRDAAGQKMSKSKGNVLDPLDIINGISLEALKAKRVSGLMNPKQAAQIEKDTQQHFANGISAMGTDALRFTFASLATQGRNINFDMGRAEGYRNFCNKLWNATRFVLMHCKSIVHSDENNNSPTIENINLEKENSQPAYQLEPFLNHLFDGSQNSLTFADKWIISALHHLISHTHKHFAEYRFDLMAQNLYQFFWEGFCDWYLELAKAQLNTIPNQQASTRKVLIYVLDTALRLLHPIMPFITETLWQKVSPISAKCLGIHNKNIQQNHYLMTQPFPVSQKTAIDQNSIASMENFKNIVNAIRNLRSQMDLSPAQKVPLYVMADNEKYKEQLNIFKPYLLALARLSNVEIAENSDEFTQKTNHLPIVIANPFKLTLVVKIDVDAEVQRLETEVNRLQIEIAKLETKLANTAFVERAPAQIVQLENSRMKVHQEQLDEILAQLKKLKN